MQFKTLVRAFLAVFAITASSFAQGAPRAKVGVTGNYGKLPLMFEVNRGQTDPQAKFISRGPGYTAFLTNDGMLLSLRADPVASTLTGTGAISPSASKRSILQFRLLGAAKGVSAVGENPQPGRVNYFIGNDPSNWRTNVPTYAQVRYKNIYPGIDLVYYGSHRQLEYDFAVSAGSDPGRIKFQVLGAREISIDSDGNLVLETESGEVRFQAPRVYQESNGQRVPVSGNYTLADSTHISFSVARFDPHKRLIIDPALVYSTYLGGSGSDQPTGIAVDSDGSVYVTGYTNSADFPLGTLGSLPTNANHIFLAKLDPTGSHLIYADYIGGSSEDYGLALTLDAGKDVYLTGSTESSNFPVVKPTYQAQRPGPYSAFLTKVSADGSSLLYSTYLGGSTFDEATSIGIDNLGQVHVAGLTMSQNFPTANAYQATVLPNQGGAYGVYGFLTTFSQDGSALVFSTYLAGNSVVGQPCGATLCWLAPYNAVSALAVDAAGNTYVAGSTNTNNFPATSGAYQTTNPTQQNSTLGFVSKFSSAGALSYSTYLYGSSGNPVQIASIAVDSLGSAYVTGYATSDGTFPITSTSICDPGVYGYGCSYAFVTKFDPSGASLLYSTFLGANNYAVPGTIALDAMGDAYVLTSTESGSFQATNAIEPYDNNADLLLVEIDPAATTQSFATYLGGSGNDSPSGMAVDTTGNIYIAGVTNSTDLPVTQGTFQSRLAGDTDAFVMKISPTSQPSISLTPTALQYSSQPISVGSQPQQVQLRNMSSSALTISSVSVTGDFAENDNCGNTLPAAGNCTLSVVFTPTLAGMRTGSLVISDDAMGAPHVISLSGIGLGPIAALTPASLVFPNAQVGSSTVAQTVTLTDSGNAALNISNVQISGDFAQTDNCPSVLASGSSCTFNVAFAPTVAGNRGGSLTITDGTGSAHTVALSGTGSDFSLASAPTSVTVKAGTSATYTLNISSVGGVFPSAVKLTCNGVPAQATCSLSSSSVTPGSNPASVTVTIKTTATSAGVVPLRPAGSQPVYAVWVQLQGLGLFGIVLFGTRPRSKKLPALIVLALFVVALLFMSACAGGTGIGPQSQPGTQPGTYTIAVTGASGALQHSVPLTLVVQ